MSSRPNEFVHVYISIIEKGTNRMHISKPLNPTNSIK